MTSLVLYSLGALIGMFALFFVIDRIHTRLGGSTLEWCGLHGGEVVVLSSIYHSGGDGDPFHTGRVVWLDRGTGKPLRRVLLDFRYSGEHQRGNLLVVSSERTAGVLDLASGRVATGADAFGAASPVLARDGVSSASFRAEEDHFEIVSGKGEKVVVALPALGWREDPGAALKAGRGTFAIAKDREHDFWRLHKDGKPVDALRLLRPKVLWQSPAGCVIAGPASLSPGAPMELVRVDADGRVAWTVGEAQLGVAREGDREVEARAAFVVDSLLVIPLKAKRDKIVALELASGRVRWSIGV